MLYNNIQSDNPPFFTAVGCVCIYDKKILLLKRAIDKSYPSCWGIPSGKKKENENLLNAIIRELYEETGIILSSSNLRHINTFHIINQDMSFLYAIYKTEFISIPEIKINKSEHSIFNWFSLNNIFRLDLVPDLDNCLKKIFPFIYEAPEQLQLFPKFSKHINDILLEKPIIDSSNFMEESINHNKSWFVSFGPPAAGKTTAFKGLSENKEKFRYVGDNSILRKGTRLNSYLDRMFKMEERSFSFNFQMEVLPLRFLQSANAPNYSLVDESIFSTLAYSRSLLHLGWLTDQEYQTFYSNFLIYKKMLKMPEIIFYFLCDIETIMNRIKIRGRKIEVFYPYKYVKSVCESFRSLSSELKEEYNLVELNTDKLDKKAVQKQCELILKEFLR